MRITAILVILAAALATFSGAALQLAEPATSSPTAPRANIVKTATAAGVRPNSSAARVKFRCLAAASSVLSARVPGTKRAMIFK